MTLIICSVCWVILAILFGTEEARYFFYKITSSKDDGYNSHPLFSVIRGIILLLIYLIIPDWKFTAALILMFSFFHDGAYYLERNKLDGSYKFGWFDQSTTSNSWFDLKHLTGPYLRTIAALLGVSLIIYSYA